MRWNLKWAKRVGISILIASLYLTKIVLAATAPILSVPSGLALAEIKITGNEFIMLQNNSGSTISDLSQYWLYGFNNLNPLASGVNSSTQQLPTGSLESGQTILLSQGGPTCGAAVTTKLSISLTDSGGYLMVVKTDMINGIFQQTAGDAVSWSSGANSAPGMISGVPSNTTAPNGAWYRIKDNNLFKWQKADTDGQNVCQLKVVVSGTTVNGPKNPGNQLLPGTPPPATIISFIPAGEDSKTNGLPPADIGLRSPVLNEILPNPASPQTDADDEFIEIYNPNDKTFDLSGFKLQTKSSTSKTKHTYTFPSGTKIEAKQFAAYPSSELTISLNNSGAQVWLLEPSGTTISQTDSYVKAKDGLAWALAKGKWYWTVAVTPNAANIISASKSAAGINGNGIGTVLGASTTVNGSNQNNSTGQNYNDKASPLHQSVLVIVGLLAILYGLYEYRRDVANWIHKLKRNRKTGPPAGPPA